ncbi:MAG TPA: prepilin-type N-terminal cleavage/methylation domain-containing protein [Thiomicrospira sp.]|nr:prepilin-type N-terminal cleavage/methylation domain-containing protein [Thiomicrospira sp.]
MKNLQAQKGFTLVEIAIVLVIIGLLLGGVLKGQELIENSKVKSVVQDFENISAAYYAYKDRKNEYPGATASDFFKDLRDEGFITGTGTAAPKHALDASDGTFTYVAAASGNLIPNKKMICASGIEDNIATNIDTKLDDGVGNTGSMRGIVETTAGTAVTTGTATVYSATGASFTVCREL